jgi:hypothetical protein
MNGWGRRGSTPWWAGRGQAPARCGSKVCARKASKLELDALTAHSHTNPHLAHRSARFPPRRCAVGPRGAAMVLGRGRGAGGGGRSRHRDRSGSARVGCWIGWGDGLGPHRRGPGRAAGAMPQSERVRRNPDTPCSREPCTAVLDSTSIVLAGSDAEGSSRRAPRAACDAILIDVYRNITLYV